MRSVKKLFASREYRSLQLQYGIVFQARGIGEVADSSADGSGETVVRVQAKDYRLRLHGERVSGIRQRNVAGFAAFRAVIQAINCQTHVVVPFADAAVSIAFAIFFGFITLRAVNLLVGGCHVGLRVDCT
jgi:hypothetical protein